MKCCIYLLSLILLVSADFSFDETKVGFNYSTNSLPPFIARIQPVIINEVGPNGEIVYTFNCSLQSSVFFNGSDSANYLFDDSEHHKFSFNFIQSGLMMRLYVTFYKWHLKSIMNHLELAIDYQYTLNNNNLSQYMLFTYSNYAKSISSYSGVFCERQAYNNLIIHLVENYHKQELVIVNNSLNQDNIIFPQTDMFLMGSVVLDNLLFDFNVYNPPPNVPPAMVLDVNNPYKFWMVLLVISATVMLVIFIIVLGYLIFNKPSKAGYSTLNLMK